MSRYRSIFNGISTLTTSLLAATLLGAFSFVWTANSQVQVLQDKMQKMEEARLPERMARIEENTKSIDKTLDDIKLMQRDMNNNISLLLQQASQQNYRPDRKVIP